MAKLDHVAIRADLDALAVDHGLHAEAGHRLEVRHGGQCNAFRLGRIHDGAGNRVFRLGFDGCDQAQHRRPVEAGGQFEVGQRRLAFGQRAGLVDGHHLGILQQLQRFTLAEQHAQLRAPAGADHDRGRRCQTHGAGAGDDQHGDGIDQREGQRRRRAEIEPCSEGEGGDGEDRRHEIHRHLVDQRLDRQLRPLCFLDHADDLRQHRVAADRRGPDREGALLVHGSGHDLAAARLGHRDRFAGDHRLVDIAFALDDFTIDRDTVAGADLHDVAGQHRIDRQIDRLAVAADTRGLGLKSDQPLDRFRSAPLGAGLEQPAEQDQGDDNRGGFIIDVHRPSGQEARREGRHQRIEVGGE